MGLKGQSLNKGEESMKNKILITGAAGFIGFHLCQSLLNDGFEVLGIDNLNNYYDPKLKHARLDQLKLIEEGMDAYIQRHYRNEDDQVWYRVRIGNFKSKENASIVQKEIESITHAET